MVPHLIRFFFSKQAHLARLSSTLLAPDPFFPLNLALLYFFFISFQPLLSHFLGGSYLLVPYSPLSSTSFLAPFPFFPFVLLLSMPHTVCTLICLICGYHQPAPDDTSARH
eukprot:TRINITY_DN69665_c0_g1_i1.p2 TRINITY_DN69665_c0_g1~~TRINITY_DN69665_c0_g1_i1.p2  ORF type:complete len:111 (+),score=9.91 TRINITY_DN69665_c0_g1_i1:185-517(+)